MLWTQHLDEAGDQELRANQIYMNSCLQGKQ